MITSCGCLSTSILFINERILVFHLQQQQQQQKRCYRACISFPTKQMVVMTTRKFHDAQNPDIQTYSFIILVWFVFFNQKQFRFNLEVRNLRAMTKEAGFTLTFCTCIVAK